MKRFWLVMLSLGLVLAFSASAFAVDVKFSGSFYAAGMYQDKTTFRSTAAEPAPGFHYVDYDKDGNVGQIMAIDWGSVGPSTAFYYQRLRVQTDFIVSPGLKLVTRFDALERIWGGARGEAAYGNYAILSTQSAGTREENQNIAFDLSYISYASPIGLFEIGYQEDDTWGTVFGNNGINGAPIGKINYTVPVGPVSLNASVSKQVDNSMSAVTGQTRTTDMDLDYYSLAGIYAINKDIQIGLLGGYKRIATGRAYAYQEPYSFPIPTKVSLYNVSPYLKAKIGPVALEAEVNYAWGKVDWEEDPVQTDVANLTAYVNALADFRMFYVGGTFAYVSGDDPATLMNFTKMKGGFLDGGVDFTPTLLMFNSERNYWAGPIPGYGYSYLGMMLPVNSVGPEPNGGVLTNAWLYQGKVGVRPIPALDIMGSVTYAKADKLPLLVVDKAYGWEVDLTATYKITNNLSYMLGGAYLFTGDYYKGIQGDDVENNFLLINKLTLTF